MEEPIITTEVEHALLQMHYEPTGEWVPDRPVETPNVVLEQRELNNKCARRILDVFYDVSREFIHVELGLL